MVLLPVVLAAVKSNVALRPCHHLLLFDSRSCAVRQVTKQVRKTLSYFDIVILDNMQHVINRGFQAFLPNFL